MWVWLFMLLGIIGVRCLIPDALGEKKKNLIFLGLSFAIIVFVVGSRSAILTNSADLRNYYNWYIRAMRMPLSEMIEHSAFEDGYLVLNKVLAILFPSKYFIVYFEAAFTTAVVFWYIYRNCDSVFLGVIIYICLGPWQFFLTGFRQAIAICMSIIALEMLKKNMHIWDILAIITILLASTIHSTVLIFFGVFILKRMEFTKKFVLSAVVMTLLMLVFLDDIVAFGNDFLEREYTMAYQGYALAGIVPIMVYMGALILWYLIWSWNNEFIKEHELELMMLLIGLCLYSLRYTVTVMERTSYYYSFVLMVVLSNGITRQKTKTVRNIAVTICVVACGALFLYRVMTQLGEYHFYWDYLERYVYL